MSSAADLLLAVDTATVTASVALYNLRQASLLAETTWQARRRHTQELLLTTQQMLAQHNVPPSRLTALAVTTGPGSFTGVRIAMSVIKGIALGLATPPQAVGIPTLSVTAAPWLALAAHANAHVWAYIQAGRGRYNWAIFDQPQPAHPTAADHHAGTATEFAATLAEDRNQLIWLVGEVAPDLAEAVAPLAHVVLVDSISALRRAGVLAQLAAQQIAVGQTDEISALQPLYLQAL